MVRIWMARNYLIIFVFFFLFLFYLSTYLPVPTSLLSPLPVVSLEIQDRHGILLRQVLSDEGGRCRWLKLEEISPYLIKATIAAEDKNFLFHAGLNPLSILRAAWQNLRRGQVISGGSTITQQLARNLLGRPRHLGAKLEEAWLALRLEHYLSKKQILEQYLNRIFYGHQAYGAEAASRLYFGKSSSELTLAEASFLAVLPRSPHHLSPYRLGENLNEIKKFQAAVLKRMVELGFCHQAEAEKALAEKLKIIPPEISFRAAHFCDWVLSQLSPESKQKLSLIQTTLDYYLQVKIEALLRQHLSCLARRNVSNGAVIVLENSTGNILAMVGSKDFFEEKEGQINGVLARRQPGSTLKPFTYALAMERGLTAATIIEDLPASFPTEGGAYVPLNYDLSYHGPLTLREALACSYNVPAVSLLQHLGPELLLRRLKALGFRSLKKPADFYGVGLTLGNGEVTLLELARAYSTLARQGYYLPEKNIMKLVKKDELEERDESLSYSEEKADSKGQEQNNFFPESRKRDRAFSPGEPKHHGPGQSAFSRNKNKSSSGEISEDERPGQVFSPQVAFIITDILADRKARVPSFGHITPLSFPFPVAVKTGTSEDFRDNWTLGYTPLYTVGVWVGNFNGQPMANVSGITGSGPLFHDIMLLLHSSPQTWLDFDRPEGLVKVRICPESGELASSGCPGSIEEIFIEGTQPQNYCCLHSGSGFQTKSYPPRKNLSEKALFNFLMEPEFPEVQASGSNLKAEVEGFNQLETAGQREFSSPKRSSASAFFKEDFPENNFSSHQKARTLSENKGIIKIIFPAHGDVFKIDPLLPVKYQRLKLRAFVARGISRQGKIEWYLNNSRIGQSQPHSGFFWNLQPGIFSLKAKYISDQVIAESEPITFRVLPANSKKSN
jgi:penicillin-binding protein 1C